MSAAIDRQLPQLACIANDVWLGERVRISPYVNLYGCVVGDDTRIGAFVEVQRDAKIGQRCKISSHSFVCSGVTIEDEVFIGHGVIFINDRYPRATVADGTPQTESDWKMERTVVRKGASIGSGAIIMCGVEIGEGALVGAGALVVRDVSSGTVVAGNPARLRETNGVKKEAL
jgi:acetyltransferase-like isoleucine patch superfamily enzyme